MTGDVSFFSAFSQVSFAREGLKVALPPLAKRLNEALSSVGPRRLASPPARAQPPRRG